MADRYDDHGYRRDRFRPDRDDGRRGYASGRHEDRSFGGGHEHRSGARFDQDRAGYSDAYRDRHDHADYLHWREEQMRGHDRDYRDWREAQHRQYDDDYRRYRDERRDSFGQTFRQWRSQRVSATDTAPSAEFGHEPPEVQAVSEGRKPDRE